MGQLLLVRHGQASWGTEDYDVLSPLGWEQSRMLGTALGERGLSPEVVVQGGMRRHRETAVGVCESAGWTEVARMNDRGWNEFDHVGMLAAQATPAFAGMEPTPAEFQDWFESATARWVSGEANADYEESFGVFTGRVNEALDRTAAMVGTNGTGVVFTSGGAIAWVATGLLLGTDAPEEVCATLWGQLNKVIVNTSVTKVVVGRRGATLVSFNEHAHLEADGLTYR
jgi:broad specificity phosphatase PhoE